LASLARTSAFKNPLDSFAYAMASIRRKLSENSPESGAQGQAFRPQPMGRSKAARADRRVLIPTVRAWQYPYVSTTAASSLAIRSSFHRQG
jgi:hypothetical protein